MTDYAKRMVKQMDVHAVSRFTLYFIQLDVSTLIDRCENEIQLLYNKNRIVL